MPNNRARLTTRSQFRKIYVWLAMAMASLVYGGEAEQTAGLKALQDIMSRDGAAALTQKKNTSDDEEKGKLYWSAQHKRIRVEMKDGSVFLYTSDGVHIKDASGAWSFVQIPTDWSRMLLEPEVVVREKHAQVHKANDSTYGLCLEEGGQFIYLFWTQSHLKGWVIGHMEQDVPHNEISVDLEVANLEKLAHDAWEPKSSFLEIK